MCHALPKTRSCFDVLDFLSPHMFIRSCFLFRVRSHTKYSHRALEFKCESKPCVSHICLHHLFYQSLCHALLHGLNVCNFKRFPNTTTSLSSPHTCRVRHYDTLSHDTPAHTPPAHDTQHHRHFTLFYTTDSRLHPSSPLLSPIPPPHSCSNDTISPFSPCH